MKKDKIIKFLIASALSLTFLIKNVSADDIFTKNITRNDNLTTLSFNENSNNYFVDNEINNITFTLLDEGTLELSDDVEIVLYGGLEYVETEIVNGIVGIYEGTFKDGTLLSVNLTVANDDVLATLVTGCLGDDVFGITYFGEMTEKVKVIDDAYSKTILNNVEKNSNDNNENRIEARGPSDTEVKLQGRVTAKAGGYEVGELSIFHANETGPQLSMITSAKINTKRSNVISYLNSQGYNTTAIYVAPIQIDVTIASNDKYLVGATNSMEPETGSTTFTIPVPYGALYGTADTIDITIETASTVLTKSKVYNANYNKF